MSPGIAVICAFALVLSACSPGAQGSSGGASSDATPSETALPPTTSEPTTASPDACTPTHPPPTGPFPVEPDPTASTGERLSPPEATEIPTSGVATFTIDDPRGDVVDAEGAPRTGRPAGRADITSARLRVSDRIELEVRVAEPRNPVEWDPFDEVVWRLVDERGEAFVADLRRYQPGPRAEVREDAGDGPGPLRCEARWGLNGGSYWLRFPAACVGDPETLMVWVHVRAHDRSTDAYAIDELPDATEEFLGPFRP